MASIATSPKPETRALKPEFTPLNDLGIRLILIPAFGVVVPNFTGYFGPIGPMEPRYWIGLAWGCVISFLLWHGNRYLLLKQRQHYDWFRHPVRKLVALIFASVFYTAPCVVLLMLAWYQMAGFGADWTVIRTVTLACVICVLFITHVYETVYLIQQRESDLLAVERLERARTEAELDALKTQVAPHFLFNSLNTLSWLIENSPSRAVEFNQNLAEVYRYILISRRRELVPVHEEIQFLRQYFTLLKIRFEESLELQIDVPADESQSWYVPPISLQILLENAVKHNEHSLQYPLRIYVKMLDRALGVENEKRARLSPTQTAGLGLSSLHERCRLLLGRGIEVRDAGARFAVAVPVQVL